MWRKVKIVPFHWYDGVYCYDSNYEFVIDSIEHLDELVELGYTSFAVLDALSLEYLYKIEIH